MIKPLLIALTLSTLQAKHLHNERYYQELFCNSVHGRMEVVLSDNTRADCITKNYAIEVDFAKKWAESIGQSLHYSIMTSKKAGVFLIIESESDLKYLDRLKRISKKHNIKVFR